MSFHLFVFITSGISVAINTVLAFLIFFHRPRKKRNIFLAIWIIFFLVFTQVVGSLIIATPDARLALLMYQFGTAEIGLIGFFYLFVRDFLGIKKEKWMVYLTFGYAIFFIALVFIKPDFMMSGVSWDKKVQYYKFEMTSLGFALSCPALFLWMYGNYKLFRAYRQSRSAIERNRLKYLLLGSFSPFVGMMILSLPIEAIRRYPSDMFGTTISTICLAYGVLRYKLLDISVIVKKGILYSVLTIAVTGIYLFISLSIQFVFQKAEAPLSIPALVPTALIVALIFQPLQLGTQRFVDRFFFRRKYDPQKLVASLSEGFSQSLDLDFLSVTLVNQVCDTLQVDKAILFFSEETKGLRVIKTRNLPEEAMRITIPIDSSLTKRFLESEELPLTYDLKEQNLLPEDINNLNLELFVPIKTRTKLQGVLVLGPKLSEDLYSLDELHLLGIIADSTALAFENASLFTELLREKENVEETRSALEVKVSARTRELKDLTNSLEGQVKERTKELQKRVDELEIFYKTTVGRELKMIDLKNEIEKLREMLKKERGKDGKLTRETKSGTAEPNKEKAS